MKTVTFKTKIIFIKLPIERNREKYLYIYGVFSSPKVSN